MENLKITKVRDVKTPSRAHDNDAGIDFYIPNNINIETFSAKCEVTGCYPEYTLDDNQNIATIILKPGESVLIPAGIKMRIPVGHALIFNNKSGIAAKRHLLVGSSVVDEQYTGEVNINLHNCGNTNQIISAGDKIVQGIIFAINYAKVEEISTEEELFKGMISDRSTGGFGSSGTR